MLLKRLFKLGLIALVLAGCGVSSDVTSISLNAPTATGALGDGSASYTLNLRAIDSSGNGVKNNKITVDAFANADGTGTPIGTIDFSILASEMRTDGNGFLTFNVSDTNPAGETIYLRATAENGVQSPLQPLIFDGTGNAVPVATGIAVSTVLMGTADNPGQSLLADGTQVFADGSIAYTITIQVNDTSGNTIPNEPVTITKAGGFGGILTMTAAADNINPLGGFVTNASGLVLLTVTDLYSATETWSLTAQAGGVSAIPLALTFIGTGATPPPPPAVVGATVGAVIIQSNDNTLAGTLKDGTQVLADGVIAYAVTIQVIDPYNNPMVSQAVTLTRAGGAGIFNITAPTSNQNATGYITDASGLIQLTVTDLYSTTETWSIAAQSGGVNSNTLDLKYFGINNGAVVVGAASTIIPKLGAAITSGVKADGLASYELTLQLIDSYTNLGVANHAVVFFPLQGTGLINITPVGGGGVFKTDATGIVKVTITDISDVVDNVQITARFVDLNTGNTVTVGAPPTFVFDANVAGGVGGGVSFGYALSAARVDSYATLDGGRLPADGTTAAVFEITVKDPANNNALVAGAVSFTVVQPSGSAVVSAPALISPGIYQISVRDAVAEVVTISLAESTGGVTVTSGVEFIPAVASLTISTQLLDANDTIKVNFLAANLDVARIVVHAKDAQGKPVVNETISITTDSYSVSILGQVVTDSLGQAKIDLTNLVDETVRVTLVSRDGGLLPGQTQTDFIDVPFIATPQQRVNAVTIAPDKFSLQTNSLDTINLTITVLDANNGAVGLVDVDVYTSVGQLSSSKVQTDATGKVVVQLSSGALRSNGVATVIATVNAANAVGGVATASILVSITGTSIAVTPAATVLEIPAIGSSLASNLQMIVTDAAGLPISNTTLTISQAPAVAVFPALAAGTLTIPVTTVVTDINGQANIDVYAVSTDLAGKVTLTISGVGTTQTLDYTVSPLNFAFGISSPNVNPYAWTVNTPLTVSVSNPNNTSVMLIADSGTWVGGAGALIVAGAPIVTAVLNPSSAVPTRITVLELDANNNPTGVQDEILINVAAPALAANSLTLQAGRNVLGPDTGSGGDSTTITANVRDNYGQAVAGAIVLFTIVNPTGGGEGTLNTFAVTDAFGRAQTTFTTGVQSTGGNGVTIQAEVFGSGIIGSTNIVIGGTPGSILLSEGTTVIIASPTTYRAQMAVIVADTNGNPMANTTVSLGAWPIQYSTGGYAFIEDGSGTGAGKCEVAITGTYPNEDLDEDTIRDPYGSTLNTSVQIIADLYTAYPTVVDANGVLIDANGEDLNNDNQLTPVNSASGTLPATVTTDEFGIAEFDLTYPKSSSAWIVDRIRASTNVLGSEATAELITRLGGEKGEIEGCFLPHSPFSNVNTATLSVSLSPQSTVTVGDVVQLNALITDASGAPVALEDVTFSFVGAAVGITLSDITVSTGIAGIASVLVGDVGGNGGTITVQANAGLVSDQANITFLTTISDPYGLAVNASPSSGTTPDGVSASVVTATVTDIYGVIASNAPIRFEIISGTGALNVLQTVTGANGQVSANLTSTQAGDVTLQVSLLNTAGNVDKYTNPVISFGVTPSILTLSSATSVVPADNVSTSVMIVTVTDVDGNPVSGEGVSLLVSPNTTATLSSASIVTDANGQGTVTVKNSVAEPVSVQATSNTVPGLNQTFGVLFTEVVGTVDPYTVIFTNVLDATANPVNPLNASRSVDVYTTAAAADVYSSYASGLDTVQVIYQVRSAAPVAALAGLTVSFSSTGGAVISPATSTTDVNGFATVTVTDAYAETVTITATTGGQTGSQTLTFSALPSSSIQLTSTAPDPAVVGLGGSGVQQSASLVFTVVDTNNNPVQGNVLVDFSIINGGLNGGEKLTVQQASTVNGAVTAVLNAGEIAGTVQIRASLQDDTTIFTDVPVTITGGLPSGDSFILTAKPLNIPGLDIFGNTQLITAFVSDFFSNPVSPGQQVQFQTDFANVSGSAVFSDLGSNGLSTGSSQATGNIVSAAPVPVDGFVTLEASTIGGSHSKILSLAAVDTYTFYAGTDGGGIFKTLDAGATWTHIGTPLKGVAASKSKDLTGSIVRGLTLDTAQPNFIYAATEAGVFISTDAGQNWRSLMQRQRISGDTLGIVGAGAAFDKSNNANGRLYDATLLGDPYTYLFKYNHTGVRSRTTVYIDGTPTTSYILSGQGIQLIGDAGFTADGLAVAATKVITADYDTSSIVPELPSWDVAIDTTSTFDNLKGYAVIYAAVYGGGVWKSDDYGESWVKRTAMVTNGGTFDDKVTTLAINPRGLTTTDLFAGTDGSGVYRSQDSGASWERMGGLANSVVQDIVLTPTLLLPAKDVWVAGKNGVHSSTDAELPVTPTTPAWTPATGFATNDIDIRALARDAVGGTLYAAAYGDITGQSNPLGGVYTNTAPAGVAWTRLVNLDTYTATGAHRLDALAVVGGAVDTVIAGTEGRAVYSSGDSGATWLKKVGSGTTALTNTLFTTKEVLHSGSTGLDVLPLTTSYQPMDDYNQAGLGYVQNAGAIYHGETHSFSLRLSDGLGNRLAEGTKLTVAADIGTVVLTGEAQPLRDGTYGGTDYDIVWTNDLLASDYGQNATLNGTLSIAVTSPNGGNAASVPRIFIKPVTAEISIVASGDPYTATVTASGGSAGAGTPTHGGGYYFTAPNSCGISPVVGPCVAAATTPTSVGTSRTFAYPAATGTYTITVKDTATGDTTTVQAVFQ